MVQAHISRYITGCAPGLMCLAHRAPGLTMQPFIELPLTVNPQATRFRQSIQLPMSQLYTSEVCQKPHP